MQLPENNVSECIYQGRTGVQLINKGNHKCVTLTDFCSLLPLMEHIRALLCRYFIARFVSK